jgi:hypothetical protein
MKMSHYGDYRETTKSLILKSRPSNPKLYHMCASCKPTRDKSRASKLANLSFITRLRALQLILGHHSPGYLEGIRRRILDNFESTTSRDAECGPLEEIPSAYLDI